MKTWLVRIRALPALLVVTILAAAIVGGLVIRPGRARGEGSTEAEPPGPTAAQTKELLESEPPGAVAQEPATDPGAAEELPHRDLTGDEALELAEAVFEPELEAPAGIYGGLEAEKFLSNYAAVVPASSLGGVSGEAGEDPLTEHLDQPVLVESGLPLRTEGQSGRLEPVDLTLERAEGELQPQNPLTEVGVPTSLGEGISLAAPEVGIAVAGAPGGLTATDPEGRFAFYPEVAENTDLIVAPTAQGVETMTDVRSAEAPTSTTYELSLPAGAELKKTKAGGAEVLEGDKTTLVIPPPTSLDAAGEPVTTGLSVSGDNLTVSIEPGPTTQFPVMSDPQFLTLQWSWLYSHSSLGGWTSNTNSPTAIAPVPYAIWAGPEAAPGPDLTSGFGGAAGPGAQANWEYWVPRYNEDLTNFGNAPSTWMYQFRAEGLMDVLYGNSANYPVLVTGLVEPGKGWVAGAATAHYGGEGETGLTHQVISTNEASLPGVKAAAMNLITWEYEPVAKRRDAYMAGATVFIVDEGPPKVLKLISPTGWINTVAEPIPYEFEDTGLGIWDVGMSYEGSALPGAGANPHCAGSAVSPCPRLVTSGAGGAGKVGLGNLLYESTKLPTGLDTVSVVAMDPLASTGDASHAATGTVLLKVDHTPPDISLSGALTEEEKLGTEKAEYPLTIQATDGTDSSPQSGVASVEVKVDGKKVTMPNETPWHPACTTQNCSFSGTWTLKASEYSAGSHEVEVVATDAAGVVSTAPLEVDLGKGAPQTGFTTPHPTYEDHKIQEIGFKATRGGVPVAGATFKCSLDSPTETPTTPCTSPLKLPEHLEKGWHTFVVAAT